MNLLLRVLTPASRRVPVCAQVRVGQRLLSRRLRASMSSTAGGTGGGGGGGSAPVDASKDAPKPLTASVTADMDPRADFINGQEYANYFCEYAKLYHQKQMLEDTPRMDAYYSAIMKNKHCFAGKVVLDMGSGTGVLAMWAAMAGASKVYAVEATPMARKARKLVAANGLSDTVEVIEAKIEEVELPGQVDIIVSEWMGYALLRESMLDSVIWARDKWLAPGGSLFPSHACIGWGALSYDSNHGDQAASYEEALVEWGEFKQGIKENYGIKMDVLDKEYRAENRSYFLENSYYSNLHSSDVIGANDDTIECVFLSPRCHHMRAVMSLWPTVRGVDVWNWLLLCNQVRPSKCNCGRPVKSPCNFQVRN